MKIKTDQDRSFMEFLCGQMEDISELQAKRMFGGYGIYAGAVFFGIVHQGRLYFKTSAETRPRYEAHGMTFFQPNAKQKLGNYLQVPVEIIEDQEALLEWASEAIGVAGQA
jgi:DNA transformation protein